MLAWHSTPISFKNKGKIQICSEIQKLKEFTSQQHTSLQDIVKKFLQAEANDMEQNYRST